MVPLVPLTAKIAIQIGDILLQPVFPALVLALISYDPAHLASHIANLNPLHHCVGLCNLKAFLGFLISLGLLRLLSRLFNILALNNWRLPSQQAWNWNDEIAVITGGCNGIGKAIVLGLVERGLKVAILDNTDLPLDLVEINAISYWKCDVTSESAVIEAADQIRETLGHPSILINNAGIVYARSILETSHEELSRIFGVNIISHWSTAKAFLPAMILKNKGHVVTVSSMTSYVSLPLVVDYSATKAGLLAFHQGLSCEIKHVYKAPRVMTTIVHPMWVETDMTKRQAAKAIRIKRNMMQPEFVAKKVLNQIFSCRSGQIFLPENGTWLTAIQGFPNWLQESIRDIGGKNL